MVGVKEIKLTLILGTSIMLTLALMVLIFVVIYQRKRFAKKNNEPESKA